MHDIAGVSITVATILAATFFNIRSANAVRTELCGELGSIRPELGGFRSEVIGKLDAIHRDMRKFYAEQARHEVRITNLEQQHKN